MSQAAGEAEEKRVIKSLNLKRKHYQDTVVFAESTGILVSLVSPGAQVSRPWRTRPPGAKAPSLSRIRKICLTSHLTEFILFNVRLFYFILFGYVGS